MVVDRRHQEHPLAEALEGEHLDQHGQRLDHEDAADHEQQELGLGHHGQAGDRPAEAERAGVAHEDRRREGVEPQEPDARSDEAAADERQIVLARW